MAANELNFGGRDEQVATGNCPLPTTEGFYVFRMPRVDKGVERGPRKPVKQVKAKVAAKGERGPGRPRVYNGTDRRIVAAALKRFGYTKGREFLRKERKLKVSLTLCRQVAEAEGITFKRGRPAA